jgi:UrcA family protein
MNISNVRAMLAATAVCAALAPAATAQTMRVRVGDLASPAGVRGFEQRLEATAGRFCAARYLPVELEQQMACRSAIREEALDQLSPAQRQAYLAARSTLRLAAGDAR